MGRMGSRPTGEGLLRYFRTLAVMQAGGLGLVRALELLAQDPDPKLSALCHNLSLQVQQGQPLSSAMQRCEGVFSGLQLASVALGEQQGRLDLSLTRLAEVEQQRLGIQQRLVSTLAQPALTLGLVLLGLLIFLPGFVFRGYLQLIDSLELPPQGLWGQVVALMRATQNPLLWLLGLVGLATLGLVLGHPGRREILVRSLLLGLGRLPGVGRYFQGIYQKGRSWEGLLAGGEALILASPWGRSLGRALQAASSARFCHALASQLEVGIPSLKALRPAVQASGSLLLHLQQRTMLQALEDGQSLSQALQLSDSLPPLLLSMVKVGEECGKLPHLLLKSASYYQLDLECALEASLAWLEPVVIALLGMVLGAMALLMLWPLAKVVECL